MKQIARRCQLTTATTYHLIRTLAYEGYVIRRDDGTYVVGLEISDRFRELAAALRGPASVTAALRQAVIQTGYSHCLGKFISGQVVLTEAVEGPQSPYLEDLVPGFDEAAHATAMGKALLATLSYDQRLRYLKESGMRSFTSATFTQPEALEADLAVGERRGMQVEIAQFRPALGCAAVMVRMDRDPERRVVLACALPAGMLIDSADEVHAHLQSVARTLATVLDGPGDLVAV